MTFNEVQYATSFYIPGTTVLPSTVSFELTNITQPITYLVFVFRAAADLQRVAGGAGGTRGYNPYNWAAWWNAGGGNQNEIVHAIQVKSGNNEIIAWEPARRMVNYQHATDFSGDITSALPAVSWSHDASQVNAVLGAISFDQIDRPRCWIFFQQPTLGTAFTTVGAAVNADIGGGGGSPAGDMYLDVLGFTKGNVDVANWLLSKPYN